MRSAEGALISVVVNNFNLPGITLAPTKTEAELVIDAQAPLPRPIPQESFQPVPGRRTQFFQRQDAVQLPQFSKGNPFDGSEAPASLSMEETLGFLIGKGADHL
jgi:hypothetical protein